MIRKLMLTVTCAGGLALAQNSEPLYKITIVSRTVKALNYGFLTGPTKIGFAPTAILTGAKGEAAIEPGRGATQVTAHFSDVPPPTRFGTQYLTYVVWAISPEGRAQNLGELMLDGSNKGKLATSTPMQAFAMVVTAEPYYTVTQPSDVVVMENVLVPGTTGRVEQVNATYELLPRKEYTYNPGAQTPATPGKPVSREQYDAVLALYQAYNAIQIASAQGGDRYAPERMTRARQLYDQARKYPAHLSAEVVSLARESTQIAEDSRTIATKRAADDRAAKEALRQAAALEPVQTATPAVETSGGADRIAPPRPAPAAPPAPAASTPTQPAVPIEVNRQQFHQQDPNAPVNRRRLLSALSGKFEATDTPRGIVVTLPESMASSQSLSTQLTALARAMAQHRDLHVEVEAHSDRDERTATQQRAEWVRHALAASGIRPDIIVARGLSNDRPVMSNAAAGGRARNRRVEIVIAGDAIGDVATWDRKYPIAPRR